MRLTYISHEACRLHAMQPGHPEAPARIGAVHERLLRDGLISEARCHTAPAASVKDLQRAHSSAHIEAVFAASPAAGLAELDADTSMNPHSLQAGLHAAGAVVHATDLVSSDEAEHVFCNVRPPGHHAEKEQAMGFCLFNSIAVAARHALDVTGLDRAAIIDFDVHHGNGTEDICAGDERIMMCSTYQHPLYPFRQARNDGERMINQPLPGGSNGDLLRDAVQQAWVPAMTRFRPDLILVSAGFDAHRDDPLAGLQWQESDYAWLGATIGDLADRLCGGRLVSVLEGGYSLTALSASVSAYLGALASGSATTPASGAP